jgi:membrane-associated protein
MREFLVALSQFDTVAMLQAGGYIGITTIVFAESGILLGIFLPGDSLLFAGGLLAGTGFFSFPLLVMLVVVAAILGDSVGYWFGAHVGQKLYDHPDSWFFKRKYLTRTEAFYAKYGTRAVILARFVPIVRTLAPILAGTGGMRYATFLRANIVGALLWGVGMTSLGYFLGSLIPESEHYVIPISLGIIFISFLPFLIEILRERRKRKPEEVLLG